MRKLLSSITIFLLIPFSTTLQSHPSSFADLVENLSPAGERFSTKSAKLLGWDCKVVEKGIKRKIVILDNNLRIRDLHKNGKWNK